MNLLLLFAVTILALALPTREAFAQEPGPLPPGGVDVLRGGELLPFTRAGKATITSPKPGTFVVSVSERSTNMWDIGVSIPSVEPVEKGDLLALELVASGKGRLSPEAFINAVFELNGDPHTKSLDTTFSAGAEARRFVFPFKALESFAPGRAQLSIRFGDIAQDLTISEIRLVNYRSTRKYDELPQTTMTYPNMEEGAAWREEALARIEKIRKGDIALTVLDAAGKPVPDAAVKVEMTRHLFRFGTAVPADRFTSETPENLKFREVLKSHFNYATIENHLKWTMYANDKTTGMRAVDWLVKEGFEVRGHNLIWPGFRDLHFFPRGIIEEFGKRKAANPEEAKAWLRKICADRVLSATRDFAGKLRDWDVINETYSNHDVMDELGREVMVEWFKLAREGDPNAVLYLNDYGILEGAGRDQRHIDFFFNDIKFIKDNGGPIGGIGIQGHWGSTMTDPVVMLKILDRFATFGLPIQITEFDINIDDEKTQAAFTRDALITLFSHPSVDAFIKWGFWENSHWLPKGAMFRSDWSKKPNALVWEDYVLNKWWTREMVTTGQDGEASLRGFLGNYTATVTAGGKRQNFDFSLPKTGAKIELRLKP